MRKVALGVVAALLLAAFPIALAGPAGADSHAQVRFISNAYAAGGGLTLPTNVYVDGVLLSAGLPGGGSFGDYFDTSALGNGLHTLQVCSANPPVGLTVTGQCNNVGSLFFTPLGGPVSFNLIGGGNYTVVFGNVTPNVPANLAIVTNIGVPGLFVGNNDVSPTDFNMARFTVHNPSGLLGAVDVCIDGDKVLTNVLVGTSQQVEVEAQQAANVQIFPSAAGCLSPAFQINLVAGTNTIFTQISNLNPPCAGDCVQVLFVDQERHPNAANASNFCATLGLLATFSADYKATFGNIDPHDPFTFPSIGEVKALADEITGLLDSGDLWVTPEIKPQWEIISLGLRNLLFALKVVNYDLTKFPVTLPNGGTVYTIEELVEGALGFKLPGVPHADSDGAVTTFLAWNKVNCAPAATPAAPAAVPAAAGPKFTG